jgi:hypothetical protein
MNDDVQQKRIEREDCAHLLKRAEDNIEIQERNFFKTLLVGLVVALISLGVNLGVVEITRFKFGDIDLIVQHIFVLRLFLTGASIAAAVVLLYVSGMEMRSNHMIEFLAAEKKYDKAVIFSEFGIWFAQQKAKELKSLNRRAMAVGLMGLGLFVIMPLGTFIFSLFRS